MFFVKRFGMLAIFLFLVIATDAPAQPWIKMASLGDIYAYDILSFSDHDIYVVGYEGIIFHYNGNDWQKITVPTIMPIWGIWGPDSNHVYAVGGGGVILFYNGQDWVTMNSGTRQWLYDIWGVDTETIYAAGAGVILKFDGSEWKSMMTGDPFNTFFTIQGNHENDVYAAGDSKKIYHYNGIGWTEVKANISNQIWGLYTSGLHVFAAGRMVDNQSVIYHYDGVRWVDEKFSINTDFWGLWGSTENNVYCVGDNGTIAHYDGQSWKIQAVGEDKLLRGISGQLGTSYLLAEDGIVYKKEANFHLELGHVSGHAGETLRIPISLTNTTMNQMEGIDIIIDYDPNIIAVHSAELTGGILSNSQYTLAAELSVPGHAMILIGATQDCVVGSGVVAYLNCHVLDDIGRTGNFSENQWHQPQDIIISRAEINENVASVHGGSVTVMNYPPIISGLADCVFQEDQGPFDIPFTVHDTETSVDSLTITVIHNASEQFFDEPIDIQGVHGQRNLHLVPSPDIFGEIEMVVTVFDGIHETKKSVNCIIQPINDYPVFTKGENIVVYEDCGRHTIPNWASNISPGPLNENEQVIKFILNTLQTNLFDALPSILPNGTLIFQPKANASGNAQVEIVLQDDGENHNVSSPQTFEIEILTVNDAPDFTPGENISVFEDSGPHIIKQWATNIVSGDSYEISQNIAFSLTTNNTNLFDLSELPEINQDGDLTFNTASNASGMAAITVTLQDNAGNENGGNDISPPYLFQIRVSPVNDPPSFVLGNDIIIFKNEGFQSFKSWATQIKAGPMDERHQEISFHVSNNAEQLFEIQPTISTDGTLSFKAKPELTGESLISIYLQDYPENADSKSSTVQEFRIVINDYPSITGTVKYYSNDLPVRNVTLILSGDSKYETRTDENGVYRIENIIPGAYMLTPQKNDDLSGLSGTDASTIFRHASEKYALNCFEMIAADVTLSGRIGATDASRVARYRAGLTPCLNDNCLEWVFTPSTSYSMQFLSTGTVDQNECHQWPPISYSKSMRLYRITNSLSDLDFVAFRLGDTTGNWSPDAISTKRRTENIPAQEENSETYGNIIIPLKTESIETISGIDFSIVYESQHLKAVGATLKDTALENNMYDLHVNTTQVGRITGVVSAKSDPVRVSGVLVNVQFQWITSHNRKDIADLVQVDINEFDCNEKSMPMRQIHVMASDNNANMLELQSQVDDLQRKLRKFDIHLDEKKGLEEVIDALKSLSDIDD